jgi:tryptophanyl-tRNA synthetase
MSKSYDNTIPLFAPEKRLRKLIMRIKTNSLEPGQPKDPEACTLFAIYRAFASSAESTAMAQRYREGIGWGDMKNLLFEYLNEQLGPFRAEYDRLMNDPDHVESILQDGARRAREISTPFMQRVREAVGIRPLTRG